MTNIKNRSQWQHYCFTLILCVVYLTPILFRFLNAYVQLALFMAWCLYTLYVMNYKIKKVDLKVIIPIVLLITLEFLYFFIGKSSAAVGNYFKAMKFYQTIIMFIYISKYYSNVYKQKTAKAIMYIFGANILYNVVMFFTMADYINYTGRSERVTASATNIFNTVYATAVMLFCGALLCALLYKKNDKKNRKIILFLFIISLLYTIVVAERATNYILLIIMLGLIISVKLLKVNHPFRLGIFVILMFVGALILYNTVLDDLLYALSQIVGSERVSKRIMSIYYVVKGSEIVNLQGTLDTRYELMMVSINTFLESVPNFLFGKGNHIYTSVSDAFDIGIGGHSQLVDILAKYGVLGSGLVFVILYNSYRLITRSVSKEWCVYFVIVFCVFLARSILGNTFEPEVGLIVFVLMPLLQEVTES